MSVKVRPQREEKKGIVFPGGRFESLEDMISEVDGWRGSQECWTRMPGELAEEKEGTPLDSLQESFAPSRGKKGLKRKAPMQQNQKPVGWYGRNDLTKTRRASVSTQRNISQKRSGPREA